MLEISLILNLHPCGKLVQTWSWDQVQRPRINLISNIIFYEGIHADTWKSGNEWEGSKVGIFKANALWEKHERVSNLLRYQEYGDSHKWIPTISWSRFESCYWRCRGTILILFLFSDSDFIPISCSMSKFKPTRCKTQYKWQWLTVILD